MLLPPLALRQEAGGGVVRAAAGGICRKHINMEEKLKKHEFLCVVVTDHRRR